MAGLEGFLIWLVIVAIIAGVVYMILRELPLPEPFKKFALLGVLLLFLILLLVHALPMLASIR